MASPEFTARNEGKFLVVEEGEHIRYTWERNGDGEVRGFLQDHESADSSVYLVIRMCQSLPEPIPYLLAKLP